MGYIRMYVCMNKSYLAIIKLIVVEYVCNVELHMCIAKTLCLLITSMVLYQ